MDFSSFFPRFIDGRIRSVFPDGAWFGGDGVVFVEQDTPDFSLLRRRVLRCRRRVCEVLTGAEVPAGRLAVVASRVWSHIGIATCPSSTESSGDFKKDAVLV